MNKKMFTVLGLAAILVSATSVACESTKEAANNGVENNSAKVVSYNANANEEKATNGKETAINTISKFMDNKVNVGQDYTVNPMIMEYSTTTEDEKEEYKVYKACNYEDTKYSIFFMLQNDSKVVEATEIKNSYMNGDYNISKDYMNEANSKNFSNGAFASLFDHQARLFISEASKVKCSSIWGYDSSKEEVYLIWFDESNSNWKDYH